MIQKALLTSTLASLLIVTTAIGPAAQSREGTRQAQASRTFTRTYVAGNPSFTTPFIRSRTCEEDDGLGCVRFVTPPKFRWLTDVRVVDVHGLPVSAWVWFDQVLLTGPCENGSPRRSLKPVKLRPGQAIDVIIWWDPLLLYLDNQTCGAVAGTTGEVRATFSK